MYCLWIGGKKIDTLEQLKSNFDLDSVTIYCCGGGLARWLRLCGEDAAADKVEKIDFSADVEQQLADIFEQPKPKAKEMPVTRQCPVCAPITQNASSFTPKQAPDSFSAVTAANDSFSAQASSFVGSSSAISSFFQSSFGMSEVSASSFLNILQSGSGMAFTTSFLSTSFSFFNTSFIASSFHEYEFEFETSGSLTRSSFYSTSSSFSKTYGSFAAPSSFSSASFSAEADKSASESKPEEPDWTNREPDYALLSTEEKLLLNFTACPLNQYGYGLHLI